MSKDKKPMPKSKKDFIAAIIILAAGLIIIVSGSIMVSINKGNTLMYIICGSIMIGCGVAMAVIGIIQLVKNKKLMDKEKAVKQ